MADGKSPSKIIVPMEKSPSKISGTGTEHIGMEAFTMSMDLNSWKYKEGAALCTTPRSRQGLIPGQTSDSP